MRSVKTMVIAAILACTVGAYGQSVVVYSVETGGNNHATDWENNALPMPGYSSGVTDGTTQVNAGSDLNWAVRVSVGGTHTGQPGSGTSPLGAANLVFDLVVLQADGVTPVPDLGAAPMTCTAGTAGQAGALDCKPTDKGFYSTINDGDGDGIRGAAVRDTWANAAFAIAIYNTPDPAPAQKRALSDEAVDNGPNFDYGWYPTANGRGGVDIDGTKPVNTSVNKPALAGKLVGFGAGYKNYNGTSYRPGVGLYEVEIGGQLGFGADIGGNPLAPTAAERPLFEGQISTKNMAPGTYYLKVVPSVNGNNILHGNVDWSNPVGSYGGAGSFAAKANSAVALPAQVNGVKFVVIGGPVTTPSTLAARKVFYNNSYYDLNNVGIDAGTGAKTDTAAIDTTKSPLMVLGGISTFANWTGYTKGLNGLIYDVTLGTGQRDPLASDFTFTNLTRTGAVPSAVSPSASSMIVLQAAAPRKVRMVFTFADNSLKNVWVKVDVGTGGGLPAETHYWANAAGEVNIGNSATNILTDSADELAIKAHPTTSLNRSLVTDPYDITKNSTADATDQLYVRANKTSSLNCVKHITK